MAFIKTDNLKGDIFGGITAGIVALPLALAFGIQAFGGIDDPAASSMGALAGLVGATFLGFFASLFGGTHSQISGPTGPMTVITASLLSGVWAAQHSMGAVLISMSLAGLFCGIFQILFGVLKIAALLLGLGTIAIIYLFPLITKKIPSTLVALLVMTIISLFLNMDEKLLIGQIPSGFPLPVFAKEGLDLAGLDWGAVLKASVIPGLTLAGLGSIDTLLTSVVADNITKTHHNSNRELVGQGIGNMVSGLFCGISGAGATMRTVVNVKSGGRSQISGMVHSMLLLAVLLGLGSLVRYVPLSVLAGILITVGWGIIDFKGFKDLPKIPRADAVVLIIVFLLTVFVDLLTAVGIGMVIACVLFMKRASDLVEGGYSSSEMTNFDKESPWQDEGGMPDKVQHKIYIQRLNGPIFFGTITKFQQVMADVPEDAKIVIIRMRLVSFMDQSGLYAMETAIKELQDRGVLVLMTIIQPQPMYMLKTMKVIPELVPEQHTFETFEDCTSFLKNRIEG